LSECFCFQRSHEKKKNIKEHFYYLLTYETMFQNAMFLIFAMTMIQNCATFSITNIRGNLERAPNKLSKVESQGEFHSFLDLGLSPEIMSAVRSQSQWEFPTPIQSLAIPQILASDTSIWCEAPTGSGKTAAFVLPLLQKLHVSDVPGIASIVICPTRELALQIESVISHLSRNVKGRKEYRIIVLYGGVPIEPQISALSNARRSRDTIDIVVATPGRLVDVLTYYDDDSSYRAAESAMERRLLDALDRKGKASTSLSLTEINELKLDRVDDDGRLSMRNLLDETKYLVIDEADRTLGKAFEAEMDACLNLITSQNQRPLQTLLFSATFPKAIEPRVATVLKKLGVATPLRVSCDQSDRRNDEEVSATLQRRLDRAVPSLQTLQKTGPASTIHLRGIRMDLPKRTQVLRKLLEQNPDWDKVLVFVATRYSCEHVAQKLRRHGIESAELHGKLDQEARARRLKAFSKGKTRVLIATDLASRGLDVAGLPAVVNYDLPRSTSDFVHRVGRTGRAGKSGTAITFITPTSEVQFELIEKRHLAEPINREVMTGFEPNEAEWEIQSSASREGVPGTLHSSKGLAYDRMNGGIKGRRKSKKDRLREDAIRQQNPEGQ
jgi:ATP-dependent RNA helicase RhlE